MSLNIQAAIKSAVFASNSAALAQYARDGFQDCGHCGGAMLSLKGNTKVAKAAIEAGVAYKSGSIVWVSLKLPTGISTQHAAVYIAQKRAFRDALEAAGLGNAVREYRTYVD